jgi:hypothetical protein
MRNPDFRWIDWNLDHATKHGCGISEIESIVRRNFNRARKFGNGKWRIEGRGQGDRVVEVIFVKDDDGTIFVIHAMPLTTRRRKNR